MKTGLRLLIGLCSIGFCSPKASNQESIDFCTLIDEMTNFHRLADLPLHRYKSVQFSSFDRRSVSPNEPGWFGNADGFGGEPIPNFQEVIVEPDEAGQGQYLICDVQQPGTVLRLWTAGINGNVRVFVDDMDAPLYYGSAEDFFLKTADILVGKDFPEGLFRQFDAVYFPIPFSKTLRIEWIGDIRELHFYHVGLRLYDDDTIVAPFSKESFTACAKNIEDVINTMEMRMKGGSSDTLPTSYTLLPSERGIIWEAEGSGAVNHLSVRPTGSDMEAILRQCILRIYFDHSSIPQVEAPLGDFFGAAPGINPYQSLAASVSANSTMESRFIMPYRRNARIEVENHSEEKVTLSTGVKTQDYHWEEGKSMHFRTRWKIRHEITASNAAHNRVFDFPYLMAFGRGRVVGAATFIYNPSNVPSSWGNWWGEGDEKIFIDDDEFPSFFGTGSEDYYNYSWSSPKIFAYPYCGQPRNDGPGNRGYVANFRWHILDDIPFNRNLAFYMELHRGSGREVHRFSYGSIVFFYALPGTIDDYQRISMQDIRKPPYYAWRPEPQGVSAGYEFHQAEDLAEENPAARVEQGDYYAGGQVLMWEPAGTGEKIKFLVNSEEERTDVSLGFTMARMPEGGEVSLVVNGARVEFAEGESVSLYQVDRTVLDNFLANNVTLGKGKNEVILVNMSAEPGKKVGIDFIWIK
jgi:hypothetical protein